ncbi:IlvD/Edd family dehydratase [Acidithrix sp. C25]|uniref:IlvD/Edd family dehydratase n=1 Tax=Acidithrix sp. C25 TaxID=1671482 RepID=UPI00191B9BDD|nr:IlvD/Edd family dehydratase [Acidithrix sp. C25]
MSDQLRSSNWFAQTGKLGFYHRSHTKSEGFPDDMFSGKPVIGIGASWSDLAPCNAHLHDLAQSVKAGIYEAGGFPFEFPTMALGETLMRPSAMLYRNLAAMEIEELIRSNPLDGVVLLTGCDKTTPAAIMGALSVDLPTIILTGGPMMNGVFRGETVGSGTDLWRFSEDVRAGVMTQEDFVSSEACVSRSVGHCTTMGTASTMACLAEALGLVPSGTSTIPATDGARRSAAQLAGRQIVSLVAKDLRPSSILSRESFENAIVANVALGGSTNAIIHLLAIAGRAEIDLELEDFDRLGLAIPTLVDLKPSGRFLMADFHGAGGLPALLSEISEFLHLGARTVSSRTLGEDIANAKNWNQTVIRKVDAPLLPPGNGSVVLFGNLAPNGAVLKLSAADPNLCVHRGSALVFDSIEEYNSTIDQEDFIVDPNSVLILRNAGPKGYPGMPEVGNLAIPKSLVKQGLRDMVRISDARMSGTSFGTVVLHVAPESASGGPLGLVQNGDSIFLDVPNRTLSLEVSEAELLKRREENSPFNPDDSGGYVSLYRTHVMGAETGADFDFLRGRRGSDVPRRST